jgi:hypothetical protein
MTPTSPPATKGVTEAMVETVARAIDPSWWTWADIHFVPTIEDDVFRRQRSLERAQRAIDALASLSLPPPGEEEPADRADVLEEMVRSYSQVISAKQRRIDELEALSPAAPELAVKVKPLEWLERATWWRAFTSIGHYNIDDNGSNWGHDRFWLHFANDHGVMAKVASLEVAQAAAQADYEARILSALASPQQGEKP